MPKRPVKIWWILILIILVMGLYLNRAYAYFFDYLGAHEIVPSTAISDTHPYFYLPLDSENTDHNLKYLALGDSLTRGVGVADDKQAYPFYVAEFLSKNGRIEYTNLAVPGSTTTNLLKNQLIFLGDRQYQYLSLMIGMNDVLTAVGESQFRTNYNNILTGMVNRTSNLIVINIPYLSSSPNLWPPYNYLVDWRTKQFNSIIESLVNQKNAQGKKIIYVDLYQETKQPFLQDQSNFSADKFHPSAKGYKLWSQIINASFNY